MLLTAAVLPLLQLGMWEELEQHYTRTAELFAEEGRPTAAAEAAARGARALEEQRPKVGAGAEAGAAGRQGQQQPLPAVLLLRPAPPDCLPAALRPACVPPCPQASSQMYLKAVEWLEDGGKDALAGDVFRCVQRSAAQRSAGRTAQGREGKGKGIPPGPACRRPPCAAAPPPPPSPPPAHAARRQAVAQLVRSEQWGDAVGMLLRFAASCEGAGARNSQCKAYLGAVVVWLYAGKAKDAWVTYQVGARGGLRLPRDTRAAGGRRAGLRTAGLAASTACPCTHRQDALGVDAFTSSDEAFAAEALLDAYRR